VRNHGQRLRAGDYAVAAFQQSKRLLWTVT
jgi:hypothetical protein